VTVLVTVPTSLGVGVVVREEVHDTVEVEVEE